MRRVTATNDGIDALLCVGHGDMRKVINVLQATAMGHGEVTEESVYAVTGEPSPRTIHSLYRALRTAPFCDATRGARARVWAGARMSGRSLLAQCDAI